MDSEIGRSSVESVVDNVDVTVNKNFDRNEEISERVSMEAGNNGSCSKDADGKSVPGDLEGKSNIISEAGNSPLMASVSPGALGASANVTEKRGHGLKKWRRLKRDGGKDKSPVVDSSKALKRGLSISGNQTKPLFGSVEAPEKSEGSIGSVNVFNSGGRLAVGLDFDAVTDSENSRDQGSMSSTAASAPKVRDFPGLSGSSRDRNRSKNVSGKSLSNSTQRSQQGKSQNETSKKLRGDRISVEKENSHSSMESDSRSSNFVAMLGAFSATSNGRKSKSYDGENSDDAQASEHLFNDDLQSVYSNINVSEDVQRQSLAADLSWEGKEEQTDNHQPSKSLDPLAESVIMLQTVQEALEKEVQKFREIANESISTAESEIHACLSDEIGYDDPGKNVSFSMETQVASLTRKVTSLENRLEDAKTMLEEKEAKIIELEDKIKSSKLPIETGQDKIRNMKGEFEDLFMRKVEAEVEYVATVTTIQDLKAGAVNNFMLLQEQKALAEKQAQMLNKIEEAESKAGTLKKQANELETYCGDMKETEEVLKMQKRVCKVTWFLFVQLILFVVLLGLFVKQLAPLPEADVVPT